MGEKSCLERGAEMVLQLWDLIGHFCKMSEAYKGYVLLTKTPFCALQWEMEKGGILNRAHSPLAVISEG